MGWGASLFAPYFPLIGMCLWCLLFFEENHGNQDCVVLCFSL